MRGQVTAIAPDGSYGQILAEDQQYYSYWTSEVRNGPATVGQSVEFRLLDGQPVEIFIAGTVRPPSVPPQQRAAQGLAAAYGQSQAQRSMTPSAQSGGVAGAIDGGVTGAPVNYALPGTGFPPSGYWKQLFLSPNGRIARRQFWLHGVLTIFIVSVVLGWIPLINVLVMIATFWASVCIAFKRFHDVGYPGWWSLILMVLMFLAPFFLVGSYFFGSDLLWTLGRGFYVAGFIVFIVQLIFVFLRKGDDGDNRFGPDPLATPYR